MTGGHSRQRVDAGTAHRLESYEEVAEALRTPSLGAFLHDRTEPFRGGTVRQIDGPQHARRRKAMGRLFRGEGDDWFREQILLPTIQRNIRAVLSEPETDGVARTDMVPFVRRSFFQLAASLIGLLGVDDITRAEALRQFSEPINLAMRSYYEGGDRDAMMARGLQTLDEFRERYFLPAYEHHQELQRQVEEGTLQESDVPHDFLMLVAKGVDEELSSDPELVLREAITDMINASTFSSSFTLLHILDELLNWFEEHPEDAELRTDAEFIYGAVAEGLRLHPIVPLLWRKAQDPVTLRSGREIARGETVCIDVRPANRDHAVFGDTADEFDPRRPARKGVYAYGLSFGTGRHMCFGLPLILGSNGVNGSHVQMVKAFFEAGIDRDPDRPPVPRIGAGDLAMFETFPVIFRGRDA